MILLRLNRHFVIGRRATIQTEGSPFTSYTVDQLVMHSAGARSLYGLALDQHGDLFFTIKYQKWGERQPKRARGLSDDVHELFFKAAEGGDYGFRNEKR